VTAAGGASSDPGVIRRAVDRVAGVQALPTALRAVLGYYVDTGVLDLAALRLRATVEERVDAIVDEAFAAVDRAVAAEFDHDPAAVAFTYDTKLTLPAELTLGHVYQRARAAADGDPVARVAARDRPSLLDRLSDGTAGGAKPDSDPLPDGAVDPDATLDAPAAGPDRAALDPHGEVALAEDVTELVVEALVDGDMRDALNDGEFADFEVGFPIDEADRRRVAEVAQATLRDRVEARFEAFPDAVRDAYDAAVAASEAHQDRDERFRRLLAAARAGEAVPAPAQREGTERTDEGPVDPREAIRREYRDAAWEPPTAFAAGGTGTDADADAPADGDGDGDGDGVDGGDLPYLATQYRRVGVIYDGMIGMYRAAGVGVDGTFERSVVLAIIGAQLWLDDVDDFAADMAEGQLTPVTAEYLLANDDRSAYRRVVEVSRAYFDAAKRAAAASDSTLTGLAVEYILRSGDPSVLPGYDPDVTVT
jgi:hypothetical protein